MRAPKTVAVVLLRLVTYVAMGAMLLNNASATYFPRQLTVLLLTALVACLVAGELWHFRSLLLLAVASGLLVVLVSRVWQRFGSRFSRQPFQ